MFSSMSTELSLGQFLRSAREGTRLTLRDVERRIGISNAYLSQLESGRIKEPSPNVLYKLTELYGVSYDEAMALAGYPSPEPGRSRRPVGALGRLGSVTPEEADQLAEYLAFLRQRKRRSGKS